MARVAVATFTVDADVEVTGIRDIAVDLGGETPVAVILLTNRHDPANGTAGTAYATTDGPEYVIGMGTLSGLGQQTIIIQDNNSVQSSNSLYLNNRLYWTNNTFAQDWDVVISAFSPDEVSLNFSNIPTSLNHEQQFTLIVFGGSDCEAYLENINLGTGTSAIDITGAGFEPDIVFAAQSGRTTTGYSSSAAGAGSFSLGIGLNDGADTQRCFGRRDGSGTLTVNRSNSVVLNNRISVVMVGGTSPTLGAQVTIGDYDANGFSLTPSASHGSSFLTALAIKAPGIDFALDDFLTRATTGVESYTGLGFEPDIVFVAGGGSTTINTAEGPSAANASSYMSVYHAVGDAAMYVLLSQNGVDPSNSLNYSNSDGSLLSLGDTALDGIMAAQFDAFDTDGFDLNYTTVDGNAYLFMGLAMTDGGGGGAPADATNSGLIFTVM